MDLIVERDIKGKYQLLDGKKLNGIHYTPSLLADFVTSRMIENFDLKGRKSISIFDPAVGDGELLYSLAKRLLEMNLEVKIYGNDIDKQAIQFAKNKLSGLKGKFKIQIRLRDFTNNDNADICKFDLIIANPPYVRTQSLGTKNSESFSEQYELEGRIDLYYVFLLGIKRYMNPNSVAGFIVSNRFMTTKSGAVIRESLIKNYGLHEVYDFGDTKLFEAAVLPSVLIFNENLNIVDTKFSSVYSKRDGYSGALCNEKNLFNAILGSSGQFRDGGCIYEVKSGKLRKTSDLKNVWSVSNESTDSWLEAVQRNTFCLFQDLGKIKVGVKTTADKIFIQKDWGKVGKNIRPEDEVLKPLITHHFAERFKEKNGNTRKILYTHRSESGKKMAIDFSQYPKAWAYLLANKDKLASREYLISSGRNWYEIWVPQEPSQWIKPKIVFRDICERSTFWLDLSGAIVNGDCYWLALNNDVDPDLIWLILAVSNSSFIEHFYDHKFNNKLYAGRRRFMTQYVEQFPVPNLSLEGKKEVINLTKEIYALKPLPTDALEAELDSLIWKSFGLSK